jgi:hypothetical protein
MGGLPRQFGNIVVKLCVYSSVHGYGHTTRLLAVIQQLLLLAPKAEIILNSPVPEWLIAVHSDKAISLRRRSLDVGLVQSDSFTTDIEKTLERIHDLQANTAHLIAQEAKWLATEKVDLILADIPPLAGALQVASGLPVWGMSNFGWDFIYADMGEAFSDLVPWSRHLYGQYSGLFKLPFAEAMTGFSSAIETSLVVNQSRFTRQQVREQLNIAAHQKMALMTFGGLGLGGFPTERVREQPEWFFVTTDSSAPDLVNLLKVPSGQWRLIELLTAADLALIKPGYSTVAECCALGIPTVCLTRPGFAEAELLIAGIRQFLPHKILTGADFFTEPWEFLETLGEFGQPSQATGAYEIAAHLLEILN